MTLIEKLQKGIRELNDACLEREEEINGLVIGLLTGVNVLLLGPPGVAKSYLVNLFTQMFGQGESFSWLLSKTSTPEELLGPISMKGLKEDKYIHNIKGKLPSKKVAFLDEIFKANSSVLNSLLTLANERIFYNGGVRQATPLQLMVGASNEYPGADLAAFYDRFPIKYWVEPLKEKKNRIKLISQKRNRSLPTPTVVFTSDEINELRALTLKVQFTETDSEILDNVFDELEKENLNVSDRTLAQMCPDIVCAHAMISGRDSVKGKDWQMLANTLWSKHTQKDMVSEKVGAVSDPWGQKIQAIQDTIVELMQSIPTPDVVKQGRMTGTEYVSQHTGRASEKFKDMQQTIDNMKTDTDTTEIEQLLKEASQRCVSFTQAALGL